MIETICTESEVSMDKLETIRGVNNQVFEMSTDNHLLLHQNKAFVYKTGAFFTARKVLNWIAKMAVNLGINSVSNNIA